MGWRGRVRGSQGRLFLGRRRWRGSRRGPTFGGRLGNGWRRRLSRFERGLLSISVGSSVVGSGVAVEVATSLPNGALQANIARTMTHAAAAKLISLGRVVDIFTPPDCADYSMTSIW